MEANPGSVSSRKAALLRELGVTRISLGVQSWDNDLLKLLGREHRADHLRESFQIIRGAGFWDLWEPVAALLAISAVLISLSARGFQKTMR